MGKKKIWKLEAITLQEGCEKHSENCRQRNLRDATIRHYRESYRCFYRFFGEDMQLNEMNQKKYNEFLAYLRTITESDVTIRNYQRNLITVLLFLIREGHVQPFRMQTIKAERNCVETYSDAEMQQLLRKPNLKTCGYLEYQTWVIINLLFSTGVRQRSLRYIQIRDIDFDNGLVTIRETKNRKILIVPLTQTMLATLRDFLKYRKPQTQEEWLFCNIYGGQITKGTCYHMIETFNKNRGVQTKGVHRFRHTFAKQWILNGGNVVTLSRLLGHSNLKITQDYINLLTSDLSKQVEAINLLDKYVSRKKLSIDLSKK